MKLNCKLKNVEILEIEGVRESLERGNLVVIDKVPTSNKNFVMCYFMGKVEGLTRTSGNNDVSKFGAKLLGWNNIYMRAIQNAAKTNADELAIGQEIEGARIKIIDSEKRKPTFEKQTPRVNSDGELLVSKKTGEKIYRTTEVVLNEEFDGHIVIDSVKESSYTEVVATEKVAQAQA